MAMPTLLDIAKANGSDQVVGLIDETVKAHPEISMGYARTIKGLNYRTLVRTANPTVGFRSANTGTAATKGSYENRLVECYMMNPRWECDKLVADAYEDGAPAYIALDASSMLEASMILLGKQFYYGTTNDALGFPGLMASVDTTNMVVDATGTTASTGTSVWAVKFGPKFVSWVWGQNGELALSEVTEQRVLDSSSNPFTAYCQELAGRPGLQVGNLRTVGRIKNLTDDSGKGLTDKLMGSLLAKFPVGYPPDFFFMTRRAREQLRASRTTYSPVGEPAPVPQQFEGIPILATDSISDTETIA
jgi:hypothetical protein